MSTYQERKRQARDRLFSMKLKPLWLAKYPMCQFPDGCGARADTVHHRRGRGVHLTLDSRWFASACHFHNMLAEDNTRREWRDRADGWLLSMHAYAIENDGAVPYGSIDAAAALWKKPA